MNCRECREHVDDYVDGLLGDELAERVREHGAACEACRREIEALNRIEALAGAMPREEPGVEVVLKVLETAREFGPRPHRTEFGPVLDAEELADFLRIDPVTLELYLHEIPCFELGGKLLFRKESVEAWIARRESTFGEEVRESDLRSDRELQPMVQGGGVTWQISQRN